MTDNEVRAAAQAEAEKTFAAFMQMTKKITLWSIIFLLIVVVACHLYIKDKYIPVIMENSTIQRYKRFKQWYAKLRSEGWGMWDSFRWALHNSGTHTLDGKNL